MPKPLWLLVLMAALPGMSAAQEGGADTERVKRVLTSKISAALRGGPDSKAFKSFVSELATAKEKHGFAVSQPVTDDALARISKEQTSRVAVVTAALEPTEALRTRLAGELERRRRYAKGLIMSRSFTKKRLPEVLRRTKLITEVWTTPGTAFLGFDRGLKKSIARLDALRKMRAALDPSHKDTTAAAIAKVRAEADKALDLRNIPSDFGDHQKVLEASRSTMKYNKTTGSEHKEDEKEQFRITNEYRMLMGLPAYRVNDMLIKAARAHSQTMEKLRRFSHYINGHPYGKTPWDRALKFGYNGHIGENIQVGPDTTPQTAHKSWLASPGHHRIILSSKYVDGGVARSGQWWTQVFGKKKAKKRR